LKAAAAPGETSGGITLTYSPTALKHLQSIEIEADYSRPWTMEKTKAMGGAIALGTVLGFGGEVLVQSLLDVDKTFPLFGAVGAASGWYLLGGVEISKNEQPKNGGFDGKLVADRPARLQTTLDYFQSEDTVSLQEVSSITSRSEDELLKYIEAVHDKDYVSNFRTKSRSSEQPLRLNPRYATTLIDEYSYDAALAAVDMWLNSVDAALSSANKPQFGLTRPPSHHACRAKAMGGCLLNSIAIAAHYALATNDSVKKVVILDIDAHHGNGIAHCVQDNPNIRFVSLHEARSKFYVRQADASDDDPRTDAAEDQGPLGNILNINLDSKTTWDSDYERLLREEALPFLGDADLLLVACGMDAMAVDWSSSLQLAVGDYTKLGQMLKEKYGTNVALGLEGGYAYQEKELAKAMGIGRKRTQCM
jgi:acetoin utilization deacetylase AcuC-like enzyme